METSIPQISRGRIPIDNSQQLSAVLNKIIQYEKNPVIDNSFYHTALHCAQFQDEGPEDGYEDRAFVLTSENIRQHILSQGIQVNRQYVKTGAISPLHWSLWFSVGAELPLDLQPDSFIWNGHATTIRPYIDSGVLYALHRGHGYKEGWWGPFFNTGHISQLNNGNKLPIVFSLNCLTGKYNEAGDCFAEAFLKKAEGGCVGIFAATETSFSGFNDAMALGMFDAIWPILMKRYTFIYYYRFTNISVPIYELGRILDQGLIRMGETYGRKKNNNYKKETWKLFHCFGDPTMQIYTDTPQNFAEPLVFLRNDSIFVHVEDGDCKITFYDKATENTVSYKGNYAGYANPSDSLVVCLDRHNYIPYIWDYSKDIYIQNENISEEVRLYKGNAVHIGKKVTSTKPEGNVNIQNSVITITGKELDLQPGTYIESDFEFVNQ